MSRGPRLTREFIDDVKVSLPDRALQNKYGLAGEVFIICKAAALDFIAKEQSRGRKAKRKVNGRQILADIRSGMDDDALIIKYDLTPRELQKVLRKMIQAGLATARELSSRLSITKSQVREAFVEVGKATTELD